MKIVIHNIFNYYNKGNSFNSNNKKNSEFIDEGEHTPRTKYLLKHEEEIDEIYKKEKAKNIDVDLNAIIMERKEAKMNKKKIEAIIKSEKEKWALLKKHQEDKKRKANFAQYDKYIVQEPNQMRILVLGESCSGKTCLIKRYIKDEFDPEYKTTLSIEAFKSELLFYKEASFRIELIDTPPLENFYKFLGDVLYFVQGIIFVFDASNKNSFLRMQHYFKMTNFYEFQRVGIIATKKDICTENDKYKYYQLQQFCQQHKAIHAFISAKDTKEDISNFIDALCPEIIPSLVNKKEELKLQYPYTKAIKNDFPKKNAIDEAIIKKAKEDDSSYYGSEDSKNKEKDREEEIKEYYLRKKKNNQVSRKSKPKINYIYNVGNINNKNFKEDISIGLEEKKEELKSFNNIIGNVNLDLEKLFQKYRPDSASLKSDEKKHLRKKHAKHIKQNNKTLEDKRDWVNVNIDALVEEFMQTKTGVKKNKKDKKSNNNKNTIKSKGSKEQNEKSEESKKTKSIKSKESKKEEKKSDKISGVRSKDIKKDQINEENENMEKESQEDKSVENKKEDEEEQKEEYNSKENNDEDDEDLYGEVYDFQRSLMNEAMMEQGQQ